MTSENIKDIKVLYDKWKATKLLIKEHNNILNVDIADLSEELDLKKTELTTAFRMLQKREDRGINEIANVALIIESL